MKRKSKSPRVGSHRFFYPVMFDRFQENTESIPAGTEVVVIQPHGCPRNGTMGMCYVERADSGDFIGLVCISSLQAAQRREVWIHSDPKGHFVYFCGREKGQRYLAGQFNTDHTVAQVEEWVRVQPTLQLVAPPAERMGKAISAMLAVQS